MPLLSSRSSSAAPKPRRRRLRRWLIPALGAVTPVGLIVVNIAVFIVDHLTAFRWTIAILAFVSGVLLNSWIGFKIYRLFKQRFRDHFLASEGNQDVVLIGGMSVVIAISFVTALFCYLGLSEKSLPNATTFLTGFLAILVPLGLQLVFERVIGRGDKGAELSRPVSPLSSQPLPPPPPPPFTPAPGRSLQRRG
jgi:energy-converting hydrogenase Eha subunit A